MNLVNRELSLIHVALMRAGSQARKQAGESESEHMRNEFHSIADEYEQIATRILMEMHRTYIEDGAA